MSSPGGGGSTESVSKTEPWGLQKYYLKDIIREANKNYKEGGPLEYYPGNTVAPFAGETEQALTAQADRARSGSPLTQASQGQLADTISGRYLDAGNPYFEQMANRVRAQVQPQIDARFAASGAGGSPLANRALGLGLGDAIGSLAYQNYGDERQRQMQGTMLAPRAAQQDYFDIGKLAEVGAARENLSQQQINEQIARHEFDQMEPWQRLGLYNQFVQGNYGGTTTTQQPNTNRSPIGAGLTSALGGGLSGAAIGSMEDSIGAPLGAGLGAGLGLLSGLF